MIYNFKVLNSQNDLVGLDMYKDKVLLIMNTATKCGYTKQYDELQEIYLKYKEKGFEILDFPSNQFFAQAPGSIDDIKSFCELNFRTTFPMFNKVKVNGRNAEPLFDYLKNQLSDELIPKNDNQEILENRVQKNIKWNFTKFLIDRNGNVIKRFAPQVKPHQITEYIEKLL